MEGGGKGGERRGEEKEQKIRIGSGTLYSTLSLMQAGLTVFWIFVTSHIQGDAHYLLFSFW